MSAAAAQTIARRIDVSKGNEVDALARASLDAFGTVHLVFNNAGVGGNGGLVWENSERDW